MNCPTVASDRLDVASHKSKCHYLNVTHRLPYHAQLALRATRYTRVELQITHIFFVLDTILSLKNIVWKRCDKVKQIMIYNSAVFFLPSVCFEKAYAYAVPEGDRGSGPSLKIHKDTKPALNVGA